mgnify:CR=1 FL=1
MILRWPRTQYSILGPQGGLLHYKCGVIMMSISRCAQIVELFRQATASTTTTWIIMIELDQVGIQHCLVAKYMIKENEIKILRQNETQTGIWYILPTLITWVYWINLSIALYGYLVVIICMIVWTKDVMIGESKMWLNVEGRGGRGTRRPSTLQDFNYKCGII